MITYYNPNRKNADREFYYHLSTLLNECDTASRDIVIVCIGSDRATGDCLGPLIGERLSKNNTLINIYGTLGSPVHAKNLNKTLQIINSRHNNPFIIAIDASLGTSRHVGYVTIFKGSLKPGVGVDKNLPDIGDIAITGIVNESGTLNHLLIQNTRLSLVMSLVDFICKGLQPIVLPIELNAN